MPTSGHPTSLRVARHATDEDNREQSPQRAQAARRGPRQGTVNSKGNGAVELVTTIAPAKPRMTLAEVRAKLEGQTGKRFWKNLDELAETPGFREMLEQEFPRQAGAGEGVDAVSRRGFLKGMGASLALAGLAGWPKQPDAPLFPYV